MSFWKQFQTFFGYSATSNNQTHLSKALLLLFTFLAFTTLLSMDFLPDKISLQVGEISDRDVIAPRTVSFVDVQRTKRLEAEVLASVANVFDLDLGAVGQAEEGVSQIFRLTRSVSADKSLKNRTEQIARLRGLVPDSLPDLTVAALMTFPANDLLQLEEHARGILRKYLQRGIRDEDLDIVRKQSVIDIEGLGLGKNGETALVGITQALLKPNFVLNVRETDQRKQAALKSIDPVRITVKTGQIIVRRGDAVSEEQIQVMEELGLHRGQVGVGRLLGLSIYVLLVIGILLGYLYKFMPTVYTDDRRLLLISLVMVLTILLGRIGHYYTDFVSPIAAGPLLIAILINSRIALIFSLAAAMFFGIITGQDFRVISFVLVGSVAGIYSVSRMTQGYSLVRTGLCIAAVNVIVVVATGLIEQVTLREISLDSIHGAFAGVVSAIVTIGLLPYLEQAFRITTPEKLLTLARPNYPLLQRLLLEAPGTYYHSILVGNLAETAADKIGADPLVCRVGAYYHDIGKIQRPYFFIENQANIENPHAKLAPSLSTMIVISHVRDGVEICREQKLPDIVADIIRQHHGTTLVSYFFRQAADAGHKETVNEEDFRYEGPKPQTKEAALIMLADGCEAAVRSIAKPNMNRIENTVRRVIQERLRDGQLDECDLTLRDLNNIGSTFIRVLCSTCHSRIEYPAEAIRELERRRPRNGSVHKPTAGGTDSTVAAGGTTAESSGTSGAPA